MKYHRQQKVVIMVINSKSSPLEMVKAGFPQGSVFNCCCLLFISCYIIGIVTDIDSFTGLFADDTSLYIIHVIVENPHSASRILNSDLGKISDWANT